MAAAIALLAIVVLVASMVFTLSGLGERLGLEADDIVVVAASGTSGAGRAPKATLLAASCRAAGIPARLGFADVRNHLSTERMRQLMKTDIFYWHGFTEIWIDGAWRKATPAFNVELCDKFGLLPLEFDGLEDSLYHEFDRSGNRHMEYIAERGEYLDVPFDEIMAVFAEHYPRLVPGAGAAASLERADWEADVERETTAS